MRYSSNSEAGQRRNPRTMVGAGAAILGAILMAVGVSSGSVAGVVDTQTVPLGNDDYHR